MGVAANTTVRGLGETPFPYIYAPFFFDGGVGAPRLAIRTDARISLPPASIRRSVEEVSASVPVTDVRNWSAHVGQQMRTQELGATLLGFFSFVALTLASVGIYGVMSFSVTRRTRELGIRAALGAQRDDLLCLALKGGAAPLLAGIVAGVLLSLALGRSIAGFLFAIEPYDPATLAATVAVIVLVGFAAAWLPARRATKVDPLIAFRTE